MRFKIPVRSHRLRWLMISCGLAIFLWLSPEDNQVAPVVVLGLGLSVLLVIVTVTDKLGGKQIPAPYVVTGGLVSGAIIGVGTAITTSGLMLFKNGLHAHLFLDYPPGLILAILERAPVWGIAGAFIGLSLTLVWMAKSNPPN